MSPTRRTLKRRIDALGDDHADHHVQDVWKRSAAGEDPLADPEYRERFCAAIERYGDPSASEER